jgi:hypothetical protein
VTRRAAEAFETRAIALQAQATAMAAEPHPAPLLARHEVLMLISTEFRRIAEELIPGGLSWEPLDGAKAAGRDGPSSCAGASPADGNKVLRTSRH